MNNVEVNVEPVKREAIALWPSTSKSVNPKNWMLERMLSAARIVYIIYSHAVMPQHVLNLPSIYRYPRLMRLSPATVLRYTAIYHHHDSSLSLKEILGLRHAESYRALYTPHPGQPFWYN